jgi:hypothetical protein
MMGLADADAAWLVDVEAATVALSACVRRRVAALLMLCTLGESSISDILI